MNEPSENGPYTGKERRAARRQDAEEAPLPVSAPVDRRRARHPSITNDLSTLSRYKVWAEKVRNDWQQKK
jgi:hypothetical protein